MTVYVAVTDFVTVVGVPVAAVEMVIVLVDKGQVFKVVGHVLVDPEFKVTVNVVVEVIVEIGLETEGVRVVVTVDVTVDAGRVISFVTTPDDTVVVIVVVVVEIDVGTETEEEHDACGPGIRNGPLSAVLSMTSVI